MSAAFEIALAAHEAGNLDEAERGYRAALSASPTASAAHNLGLIYVDRWRYPDALEWLGLADRLQPDTFTTLLALGGVFLRLQRPAHAEHVLRRALAIRPGYSVAIHRLGWALLMQGRYREGWPCWEHRDSRRRSPLAAAGRFPEWTGEPLAGKSILIWGEQGIGDEVQAARFLPALRALGASRITVACLPVNVGLFKLAADVVLPRTEEIPVPDHDYWSMMWSLPGRLGSPTRTRRLACLTPRLCGRSRTGRV